MLVDVVHSDFKAALDSTFPLRESNIICRELRVASQSATTRPSAPVPPVTIPHVPTSCRPSGSETLGVETATNCGR